MNDEIHAWHYRTQEPVKVRCSEGRITRLDPAPPPAEQRWLAPGLFDLQINGFGGAVNEPIAPFFSPVHATRNRITPGIQFLIHANIKAAFEYQIRPQQAIFDPAGNPITKPFRTNSAVAGLEFVY